ncbi:hypothetical protein EVAR_14147_1 [Eumeta japonica]|uniref:Uncharacterized protein n=1 Tax=Eumeta variegata TaxID=151549 RepID=A0A4C1UFX0_EUMVA|nr:hypothetical protein EVAR_14147_1 [Eumeta japonica]
MIKKYGEREEKEKILRIENWNQQSDLTTSKINETKNKTENVRIDNRCPKTTDHNAHKPMRNRMGLITNEWAIRLYDVMVEALLGALKEKHKKLGLPDPKSRSLHGLAEAVKVYYRKNEEVRKTASELAAYLLRCIDKEGKFRRLYSMVYHLS